jgi:hypothetical protein
MHDKIITLLFSIFKYRSFAHTNCTVLLFQRLFPDSNIQPGIPNLPINPSLSRRGRTRFTRISVCFSPFSNSSHSPTQTIPYYCLDGHSRAPVNSSPLRMVTTCTCFCPASTSHSPACTASFEDYFKDNKPRSNAYRMQWRLHDTNMAFAV